jgi:hypothetical protein
LKEYVETYEHKFLHNLRVINLPVGRVFPSHNWDSACGLYQPACKCLSPELGGFSG